MALDLPLLETSFRTSMAVRSDGKMSKSKEM
ncbi:MAG: hypothetical protein ACLSXO_08025 [Coprococcus sp.]